jgi:hypothetical protein
LFWVRQRLCDTALALEQQVNAWLSESGAELADSVPSPAFVLYRDTEGHDCAVISLTVPYYPALEGETDGEEEGATAGNSG